MDIKDELALAASVSFDREAELFDESRLRIEELEVQLAERTQERDELIHDIGRHVQIASRESERVSELLAALAQAQTDALEKAATIALTTARRADIVSLQLQHLPDRNAIAYAYATGAEHMASDIAEAIRQAMQDTGTKK